MYEGWQVFSYCLLMQTIIHTGRLMRLVRLVIDGAGGVFVYFFGGIIKDYLLPGRVNNLTFSKNVSLASYEI